MLATRSVAGGGPVVVEADHRDDVVDVGVVLDGAGAEAGLAGKDGVVVDAARVVELVPDGLGEARVEDAVAVQVAELLAAEAEAVLAAAALAGLDPGPGGDGGRDALRSTHETSVARPGPSHHRELVLGPACRQGRPGTTEAPHKAGPPLLH